MQVRRLRTLAGNRKDTLFIGYKGSGRNYSPVTTVVMFQHDTTIGNSTSMVIEIVLNEMASFKRKEVYIFFVNTALNGVV